MRFLGWMLRALVLLAVYLGAALLTMRFAIHGREVIAPTFVGMNEAQATHLAAQQGLNVVEQERFYSMSAAEGQVMSQSPASGVRVRRGSRVRFAISMGQQKAVIPDLVGQNSHTADAVLRRHGMNVGSIVYVSLPDLPPDQVIAQSPPANAQGVTGPGVNLLVNSPAAESGKAWAMPEFIGSSFEEVKSAADAAGLRIAHVEGSGAHVVAQRPAPGARVTLTTELAFTLGD